LNSLFKNKLSFGRDHTKDNFKWTQVQLDAFLLSCRRIVSVGFSTQLLLQGIGYKFKIVNDQLQLFVGKRHTIFLVIPVNLCLSIPKKTKDQKLIIFGLDKKRVRKFSALVRSILPPEVYKGKGIRYLDEHVTLKRAKKN
jgi:large subunit ribosomal protein L6